MSLVQSWPVDTCSKVLERAGCIDDNEYIIDAKDVLTLMHVGYGRCWLVIHAQGTRSHTEWLQRHEDFIRKQNLPYTRYFGADVFSGEAQVILSQNLKRVFLKKKELAECYLTKVLEKEAMIAILQEHNGVTYKKAEAELMASESKTNASYFRKLLTKFTKK